MSEIKVGDLVRHNTGGYIDEIGLVVEIRSHNNISVMWAVNNGIISYAWSEDMLARISDEQT